MQPILSEILALSRRLIEIPAFSTGPFLDRTGVQECFGFIVDYLKKAGLRVIEFSAVEKSPALYADFGRKGRHPSGDLLLTGHFDRVSPQLASQRKGVIEGDWLKGRGAADMLVVVSTFLVFLKDAKKKTDGPFPKLGLLLVGNEEPGEAEKWGTPHVLARLNRKFGYTPRLMIVGERTGEGRSRLGRIEVKNRGVVRIKCEAKQKSGHTALLAKATPLDRLLRFVRDIERLFPEPRDPYWRSTFKVSFMSSGEEDSFNISPSSARAGLEIRPVPEDDVDRVLGGIEQRAAELGIRLRFVNREKGVEVSVEDPRIKELLETVARIHGGGMERYQGRGKLPGSQARFVPDGCAAVVFGQSGKGPHSENEAHYNTSIMPYHRSLQEFAKLYRG